MSDTQSMPAPAQPPHAYEADSHMAPKGRKAFFALALASAGVVFGDIGTSPLYAFKESVAHMTAKGATASAADIIGVISLMFWSLMVVVTLKYVLIFMRFDNRGEGGTLSLMALVQRAGGRGGGVILTIGMIGAGLFFGDAMLTPAISVLSAVEGLSVIDGLAGRLDAFVVPLALILLVGLFAVQARGTQKVGRWFGPICTVWFAVLAVMGVAQIIHAPHILLALNPLAGIAVFADHPLLAPAVMGSVFLTVTGAEALYADMGHFGRKPIQMTWLSMVLPCLTLNYLGQGALVLNDPSAARNPFFLMAPDWFQIPLVVLATAATVIASQAVISGAFSLAQQAVQLGLLPRLKLVPTSEEHAGQIYAPQVNWILALGVGALVLTFRSSSALASAYGISVVGAMITSTLLAVVATKRLKGRPLWLAAAMFAPFLVVETGFAGANLLKVAHGGYVPLAIASVLILVMVIWRNGVSRVARAEERDVALADILPSLTARPPMRAKGMAVFLTANPTSAPVALLHNLKHNQVLHEQVLLLTVKTLRRPRVTDDERVKITEVAPGIRAMTLTFGFMETPDVTHGLTLARSRGLDFDLMRTSFFLSRRAIVAGKARGLARLRDLTFLFLTRNTERAADYFQLPAARVVELGTQLVI